MKQYTHAWLAMMAMKRIEYAKIPVKQQDDAKALITWFKNYRDLVLQGAWYPDSVFKDMSNSHIAKYFPLADYQKKGSGLESALADVVGEIDGEPEEVNDENPKIRIESKFRKMPQTLRMFNRGKGSVLYDQPYIQFKRHNLCDRCESFTESLIDSFKILTMENPGAPVIPSNNHIAMRFFILSHYIADGHMPLHCDARSFYNKNEVHAFIEKMWDDQVQAAYKIDEYNERFYYDKDGYPLLNEDTEPSPLIKYVEKELRDRSFSWDWGDDNNNTWDYMSGITQYSYLLAYDLIPADRDPKQISTEYYMGTEAYQEHFEEYSKIILGDAVESIAKVWLHAWCRYRSWFRDHELGILKAKTKTAQTMFNATDKIIDTHPGLITKKQDAIEAAEQTLQAREDDLNDAISKGKSVKTKTESRNAAARKVEKLKEELSRLEAELDKAVSYWDIHQAVYIAAQLEMKSKEAEIEKYGKTNSV